LLPCLPEWPAAFIQFLGETVKEIIVAPNSADTDLFNPGIDGSRIRSRMGWKDKFVIMHFGTMGRANGLDFL